MTRPHGIVLYDFYLVKGGAEKVSLCLSEALENADLCFGSVSRNPELSRSLEAIPHIDLGAGQGQAAARALKTLWAFSTKTDFLSRYDWVIYSGSYAPVAVKHHLQGINLLYCHALPRFAYDLKGYYLDTLPIGARPMFNAFAAFVRRRYEQAVKHMDLIIANSVNVRDRIRNYLGRDATVVHPPCDTQQFLWRRQGDYYLSTARLEPYKGVNRIIEAFLQLPDRKLVVASSGSELPRLRQMASGAPNISFTGWLDEPELNHLMGNAIATLYLPKDEDFGMSPVESMAAGKPVIGVAEGGLLETIVPEQTGILLTPNFTAQDIAAAVNRLGPEAALRMRPACERQASRFSEKVFIEKISAILRGLVPDVRL